METLGGADLASVAPEIALGGVGLLVLLVGSYLPRVQTRLLCLLASAGVITGWLLSWNTRALIDSSTFGGLLEVTPLTFFVGTIVLLLAWIVLLAAPSWLERECIVGGQFPALILWSVVGCLLAIRATEILTLLLALAILSVSLSSLLGLSGRMAAGQEAALKYFLMLAFVGTFTFYGVVLLYGRTGTTYFAEIAKLSLGGDLLAVLGLLLIMAGVFFRMAAVPFHSWAPDVYQGVETPLVAYLSTAPIAVAAIVSLRLLDVSRVLDVGVGWSRALLLLSIASMLFGHLLALVQVDIKRMLAYSCIAQIGTMIIPLADQGADGYSAMVTYLLAYCLMISGAFVIVGLLYARAGEQHLIGELAGWGYRFPVLGFALTICLLSLAGFPPTFGFIAKSLVFLAALRNGHNVLAGVGLASSLLGIVYCVRVIAILYLKPEVVEPAPLKNGALGTFAALTAASLSLALGILPERILHVIVGLIR